MQKINDFDASFLREEYFHLQKAVESFDWRELLVKGWSVTASLTAIGMVLKEKSAGLLLVASSASLLF